jgi:hypothetical protein
MSAAEPNQNVSTEAPLSAAERLAASRARIAGWLEQHGGRRRGKRAKAPDDTEDPSWWAEWRSHPIAGVVVEAVLGWWAAHPLRAALVVGDAALRDTLAPLARKHPVAMVGGALLVGAMVARTRPWRLVLKSALLAGLLSQVASRLVAQVPLDSVLQAFTRSAPRDPSPPT